MKLIKRYHVCGSPDEEMGQTLMISQWKEDSSGELVKVGGHTGDPSSWYKAQEISEEEYRELRVQKSSAPAIYSEVGLKKVEENIETKLSNTVAAAKARVAEQFKSLSADDKIVLAPVAAQINYLWDIGELETAILIVENTAFSTELVEVKDSILTELKRHHPTD